MDRELTLGDGSGSWLGAFDDEVRMTRPRRRALVATGLGEFVDAYDLIVISGALIALKPHFHLGAGELGWLSAAAFFGSAVGAAFFGDLVDRIGRRRVFVLNLIAFVGLALVSAVLIAAGLYEWLGTESWRVMFAVGALPAVAVLSLRRGLPDSPRGCWRRGGSTRRSRCLRSSGSVCAIARGW